MPTTGLYFPKRHPERKFNMTYLEYLQQTTDEFEKAVIIVNLARKCPNYDMLSPKTKEKVLHELLNKEMPNT